MTSSDGIIHSNIRLVQLGAMHSSNKINDSSVALNLNVLVDDVIVWTEAWKCWYIKCFASIIRFSLVLMESNLQAVSPISADERHAITILRSRLQETMPEGIPDDLNTDFNLNRWIRGYDHDIDRILQAFPEYVASRRAAGFDVSDHMERFFEMPSIKPYLPFIAASRLGDRIWSDQHNAFLFVERAWSQPKEFVKALKCSDYMMHCFGYSELLLQYILQREKIQKADKGAVQFIVIFDMSDVNISDYLNPISTHMKLWQLRSDMWQDWYPGMVQKIFLVNPPKLVSALWGLVKRFLNDKNCNLVEIVGNNKELLQYLPKSFVPKEFGGDFVNSVPPGDESGMSRRRKITADDHLRSYEVYRKKGIPRAKPNHRDIATKSAFTYVVDVPSGHVLLWDFSANHEVDFMIYVDGNKRELVYPRLRLISTKLPEEGCIENLPPNQYTFEFYNGSNFFNLKLDYSISVAPV